MNQWRGSQDRPCDRNEGGSTTHNTMHVGWSLQLQRLAAARLQLQRLAAARLQLQRLPSPAPLLLASNCSGTLLLASNNSGSPPIPCCCSPPTAAACYYTLLCQHTSVRRLNHRQDPLLIRRPPSRTPKIYTSSYPHLLCKVQSFFGECSRRARHRLQGGRMLPPREGHHWIRSSR